MENIVAQRIKSILDARQISITSFAKMIGMLQVTCNRQIRGDQAVSLGLIEGFLSTFPDISAEWLLRGEGEMYRDNSKQKKEISLTNPQDDSIWKAKYEAIKDCYDTLVSTLGSGISKKNANVG